MACVTVTEQALSLIDVSDSAACGPDDCAPAVDRTVELDERSAETYAEWFAVLADPTRVRLLHTVSTSRSGAMRVGDLAEALGISQSTCSHHVKKLAEVGFVAVDKVGTASVVSVNPACCTGLPHAADVVMGTLAAQPCCPEDLPLDVSTRAMTDDDLDDRPRHLRRRARHPQRHVRDQDPHRPQARRHKWLPGHRWVAELDGNVVGWAAAAPVSDRELYAGVAETSVYVTETARGRGVGKALLHRQVTEADAGGLWTLQTSIFPENRASIALHHSAGYRTLAVRPRIAKLDGVWRDTVLLERRRESD